MQPKIKWINRFCGANRNGKIKMLQEISNKKKNVNMEIYARKRGEKHWVNGPCAVWVFLENVEGHVTLGLSTVLADLEEDGYAAAWGIFSASEVGAPHQRKRVFILAHRFGERLERRGKWTTDTYRGASFGAEVFDRASKSGDSSSSEELANSISKRGCGRETDRGYAVDAVAGSRVGRISNEERVFGGTVWPSRPGERQYGWEPPRVVHGDYDRIANSNRRFTVEEARLRAESIVRNMENALNNGVQRRTGGPAGNDGGGADGETSLSGGRSEDRGANVGQTQPPMGGNAYGPTDGLDFSRCIGLSDQELEEIYGWMVKGTNRTDELRMCGNGVVPQTAERAFRVLYEELSRPAGTNNTILGDNNAL